MQVQIYQPTKSTMQSGTNNSKHWLIDHLPINNSRFIEPLIGWTASTDMQQEVKLRFNSKEEAIEFAKAHNMEYEVMDEHQRKYVKKNYADNFR